MFLKVLFTILIISVFVSCDFISPKKASLQNLNLTDTNIDYNTVDVYPLLSDCNNCDTNEKQNQCFENEFVKNLEKTINKNKIEAISKFQDTVFVDLLIDNTGKISISKIHESKLRLCTRWPADQYVCNVPQHGGRHCPLAKRTREHN